jgi:hypothetical protein
MGFPTGVTMEITRGQLTHEYIMQNIPWEIPEGTSHIGHPTPGDVPPKVGLLAT